MRVQSFLAYQHLNYMVYLCFVLSFHCFPTCTSPLSFENSCLRSCIDILTCLQDCCKFYFGSPTKHLWVMNGMCDIIYYEYHFILFSFEWKNLISVMENLMLLVATYEIKLKISQSLFNKTLFSLLRGG
jgi:hypothetical protein